MQEIRMVLGPPSSGKSELSKKYIEQGYVHLNRDSSGGKVIDLLPDLKKALASGKSVVLDNLFSTAASRKPFLEVASQANVPVYAEVMGTSIEDSCINALHRMWARYKQLFFTPEDIKAHARAKQDPNIFPIVVLFKYKKEAEKPTLAEGFAGINTVKFVRRALPPDYTNKAVIFDFDDTLRKSSGEGKFPTNPTEVMLLPDRKEKLAKLKSQGYLLLGASNQSGIARGQVTFDNAVACFEQTNKLLGQHVDYLFCPHNVPPNCYCRKPQPGLGVALIHAYKLNPAECIFVGDQTTDATFAKRLGFQYVDATEFFKEKK
jgi:HAD superfamily hydrolase (TIGR01662 family)